MFTFLLEWIWRNVLQIYMSFNLKFNNHIKGCSFLTSQGLTAKAYCICTSNWILMFSASWISQRNVYSHCNSYVYEHEAHFRDLHRLTAISWTITLPKLTSSTGFSNFNLHQWYFTKLTSKTMGYKLKWINWLTDWNSNEVNL